jgi:hypothetical protein
MDALMKLSRDVQIVLGGAVLYVILSFFDWQSYSAGGFSVGENEWHGIGVLSVLIAIVLVAWEVGRALDMKIAIGSLTPGMVSAGLALLLLVFTVITFLDWSQIRAWPEWVGLILSIAIGVAAFRRAKGEGVEMPQLPKNMGSMGGGGGGSSTGSGSSSSDTPSSTDSSADA